MIADFKIQWFPGHMTKAKRMMQEQLRLVDAVIEMLDARVPRSSANPLLASLLGSKPRVVAINKTDMADSAKTELWLRRLKSSGLPVCAIDCANGRGLKQLLNMVREAAKPAMEKWLKKGVRNRPVRVMIVGIPNVGKSTLINRLAGQNRVNVADKPGVTRGQQWITLAKGLELLDTPGVLWPKFEDPATGFKLAVTGAVKEEVFDREQAVKLLLAWLLTAYPEALQHTYAVHLETEDTVEAVMTKIAASRGCLKAGGLPDIAKAAQLVLKDFRSGRIGCFTLDEP